MISHDLKCIFLHPNKCGGKSIENTIWDIVPEPGSADHRTIENYIDEYGMEVVSNYYVFMFSRNPWERITSIYFGRKQILKVDMPSFEVFVKDLDPDNNPTKSQLSWIKNKGDIVKPDFIGRVENYQSDWKVVCDNLGITKELPHLNASKHMTYQNYYNDQLKDIIYDRYKSDIEFFNYKF